MANLFEMAIEKVPTAALIGLSVLVVLGLILWLLGHRLAKPAVVVCGVVLGAMVGAGVSGSFGGLDRVSVSLITLGGAVGGGLLAGLLFRLWMGLSGALVLAAVTPAAVLVWQGAPPLQGPAAATQPTEDPPSEVTSELNPDLVTGLTREQQEQIKEAAKKTAQQVTTGLEEAFRTMWARNNKQIHEWWANAGGQTQQLVLTGLIGGAVVGLLLGLLAPHASATLQTATVGTLLMLLPGRELLAMQLPDYARYLPQGPRGMLILIGLITVVGVGLQWMQARRKADD